MIPTRYSNVLPAMVRGELVAGAVLNRLHGLRPALAPEREYGAEGLRLAIKSAIQLACRLDDSIDEWEAKFGILESMCVNAVDAAGRADGLTRLRAAIDELAAAADYAAGLDRAGLLKEHAP